MIFKQIVASPIPVSGLKLPSEPCFCRLQPIIVSQRRGKNCGRYLNKFCNICKFTCLAHFCRCIIDHCNDAKVITAMLPISVRYLCRNTKQCAHFSRYLKRFLMESRFLPSFQISGRMYLCTITLFQISL